MNGNVRTPPRSNVYVPAAHAFYGLGEGEGGPFQEELPGEHRAVELALAQCPLATGGVYVSTGARPSSTANVSLSDGGGAVSVGAAGRRAGVAAESVPFGGRSG